MRGVATMKPEKPGYPGSPVALDRRQGAVSSNLTVLFRIT